MSEIFGNGIMGGGGLTNSKLALANAQAADVRSGKKFYAGDKQIKTGALADVTQATPAITVDAAGKITASATQAAGVVAAGTKSATKQLPVQAAKTVIPSASAQTAVGEGVFTTGIVTVAAVYAVIGVTYPSGSVCTCTNGTLTLTAKDTSGKALFVIPSAGTWTVKAVSGSQSASKAVSITAEGQVETVTLMFKLYLFTSGEGVVDDWTPLYGGYTNAAVTSEKMTLNGGEAFYYSSAAAVTSNNAIDLSGYSKLVVDVQTNKAATDNVYAWVGVSATKFTRGSETNTISISNSAAYTKISTTTRYEIEVDIANINTGYVFVASDGTNINTTAYNIWLE